MFGAGVPGRVPFIEGGDPAPLHVKNFSAKLHILRRARKKPGCLDSRMVMVILLEWSE